MPQAWSITPLDAFQVNHTVIFNPTFISQVVTDFLKKNGILNAFVSIGLSEAMIWEHCCWTEKEQPMEHALAHQGRPLIWNYVYVSSNEDKSQHLFYLFGLSREVLFQYQLLALTIPFNCRTITSKNRALLHATNENIPLLYTNEIPEQVSLLAKHCLKKIDTFDYKDLFEASEQFYEFLIEEKEAVFASLGLFLLGKSYELQ